MWKDLAELVIYGEMILALGAVVSFGDCLVYGFTGKSFILERR